MTKCLCGCGQEVTFNKYRINNYIKGHNRIGKKQTDETKIKLSESHKRKIISEETKGNSKLRNRICSKETKEKMSKSHYGHKTSEETRRKIGQANKGKIRSDETKIKLSESHKGKHPSEETRNKMRLAKIGNKTSEETRRKIGLKSLGRKHTKESKLKLSLINKGKKLSIEHKRKIGIKSKGNKNMLGKHHSEEIKKKISELMKGKNTWSKGKHPSEESRRKMSESAKKHIKNQIFPIKDSKPEKIVQAFLNELNIDFIKHKWMDIPHGHRCDVFIPSMNLIIESDGDFFHCNPERYSEDDRIFKNGMTAKERWELDRIRTKELLEKGFKVLRLWEHEINAMSIDKFKNKLEEY